MMKRDIVLKATPEVVSMASRLGFEVVEASKVKIVRAGENLRSVLERGEVKGVYDVELLEHHDSFHYRRSGINHILCDIMARKNISLVFNIRTLLEYSGRERAILFGRVTQNIRLCRKYKVSMKCGSLAEKPEQLRSLHDAEALLRILGMRDVETRKMWE